MASVEVAANSPLAQALQNAVQPKLAEQGWSSGAADDNALSEYVILMLTSGKTQEQIAAEMGNDLLGLGPEDADVMEFARWLFDQVQALNAQINGASAPLVKQEAPAQMEDVAVSTEDATMSEGTDGTLAAAIPTGPKSMRNGTGNNGKTRDKRMLGQLKNAMDRSSDQSLHRIRGAAAGGQGRINQHGSQPPRGPKSMAGKVQNVMAGRLGQGMNPQMTQNMMNGVNPQQQMALLKMLEEQSRMMAQILGPGAQQQMGGQPAINPAFFGNQRSGKSLFERVDRAKQGKAPFKKQQKPAGDDVEMDGPAGDGAHADGERGDQASIPCKFQLSCTSATCPYAHQSPAAPPGISIDATDKCTFGPACQNKKCTATHPSPAQRRQHLGTTVDCKFYPNCTNPSCPFRHPSTPPCRNGADCPRKDAGCKFSHSTIACRYNPCLNPHCPFAHAEGQRRGKFEDKVWTAGSGGEGFDREAAEMAEKGHVSERRFVDGEGEGEEEVILPGRMETAGDGQGLGSELQAADVVG